MHSQFEAYLGEASVGARAQLHQQAWKIEHALGFMNSCATSCQVTYSDKGL
jgi:hypothetical protein